MSHDSGHLAQTGERRLLSEAILSCLPCRDVCADRDGYCGFRRESRNGTIVVLSQASVPSWRGCDFAMPYVSAGDRVPQLTRTLSSETRN